jgi:uncharacterized protein with HEPN domain
MAVAALDRARHIKESIAAIRAELRHRDLGSLLAHPLHWAGFKYLLLTISEAARNLPPDWQQEFGPDIEWQQIADLGNILRHAYHTANVATLWNVYVTDLDPLEAAIDAMLAANAPTPPPPSNS